MQHIGVIGLGTMGANLARNAARNGAHVSVFNRTPEKVESFLKAFHTEGSFKGFHSLKDFVQSLPKPRFILLMVSAGSAVDDLIKSLLPFLSKEDILIDGGNSLYSDTDRRFAFLAEKGISFIGLGVSGGEEGALKGPSMMPGGEPKALKKVMSLFLKMTASDYEGGKCVAPIGPGGAGHFVKMVHNGIEYAVMQLIAEAYGILKSSGMSSSDIARFFTGSVKGDLRSYLMEVTAKVLQKKDGATGEYLVDLISDVAGQKGTGKWTVEAAASYGVAIPTITAAVEARFLSASPETRSRMANVMPESLLPSLLNSKAIPSVLRTALKVATLSAYAQGFDLLAKASAVEGWDLSLTEIARIWKGGCIIRSTILDLFLDATRGSESEQKKGKKVLLKRFSGKRQEAWRSLVLHGLSRGIPIPAFASTIAYFDSIRSARLPQNLIQAQRDFFGAHGFERIDTTGKFHADW